MCPKGVLLKKFFASFITQKCNDLADFLIYIYLSRRFATGIIVIFVIHVCDNGLLKKLIPITFFLDYDLVFPPTIPNLTY